MIFPRLTLGITNVIGGFLSAIPSCGSFSRSAVNDASGVKSPMAGLFTGNLILTLSRVKSNNKT